MQGAYKMFAAASGDGAATLDVPEDGTIVGALVSISADLDADGESLQFELSFASNNGFTTNDTRGSLLGGMIRAGLLTSGAVQGAENYQVSGLEIPVNAGERLHLHLLASGAATLAVTVWLYIDVKSGAPARAAVRRR